MRKKIGKIRTDKEAKRARKRLSIRKKVIGDATRPRVCAIKTAKNLTVLVVDDAASKTLFQLNSYGRGKVEGAGRNKEGAKTLGLAVGEKLKANGTEEVVFDRSGFKYHGVIAAIADGVREAGVKL